MRQDLGIGEPPELIADRVELGIERLARPLARREPLGQRQPVRRPIPLEQVAARLRQHARLGAKPQVGRTEQLVLPHRQPADELRDPFVKRQLRDQRIHL